MIDNYNTQPQLEAASIFERAVAFLVDFLMFLSVYVWSSYVMIVYMDYVPGTAQAVAIYILFIISFVLYTAFLSSGGRQTLGKFLVGIKVVSKDGESNISFVKGIIRGIGYYVDFLLFFSGFALAIFNKNSRALHDFFAGSRVISVREKSAVESTALAALGTVLIGMAVFYMYFVWFMMPSPFQKARVEAAQDQVNRLAYLQELHKDNFGYYTADLVRLGLISGDAVQMQRDIQRNLRRKGFSMGITRDGFKISGIAKDEEQTVVSAQK